jgi:hypothetical protein
MATNPSTTGVTATQYLNSIWSNCATDFAAVGINVSAFENLLTNGMNWVNLTTPGVADLPLSTYLPGGIGTLGSYFPSGANAVTIPGTNTVLVGSDYYTTQTQTQQIAIAIHEALHIYLNSNPSLLGQFPSDGAIMGLLNQDFGAGLNINGPTSQISNWILGSNTNMSSTTTGGCTSGP